MRYQDVFVPGGFPRHTYNPRVGLRLEQRLAEVRENLCKLVTVTGQTKSGKTVLTRKVLPQEDAIWIDGGTVSSEEEFWQLILQRLSLFQGLEEERSSSRTSEIGAVGKAEANFLVAKGSGELSGKLSESAGKNQKQSRTVSSRVSALAGLRASSRGGGPVATSAYGASILS